MSRRRPDSELAAARDAVDWDALRGTSHSSKSGTNGYGPIAADAETGVSQTFDVSKELGVNLPVRQITLAEGVNFQALMTSNIAYETKKYGRMLGWFRLGMGSLYTLAAIGLLFVVIFVSNGKMPLYKDPLAYSSLDKKWEVALDKVGDVHVDWALLALMTLFAPYHFMHFLGFVRDAYLRQIFYYQTNIIRWVFHGLVGGLLVGFFSIVMGVSSVIVFVLLTGLIMAAAAGMLFSELINLPTIYRKTESDTLESVQKEHGLTPCEARVFMERGYFIKRVAVMPWVFLFAVIVAAGFVGVVSFYFWSAVADTSSKVPWYAWTTYFITVVSLALMVIVNGAALLLDFAFLKNFLYIDLIHNVIELFLILANVILIIVGFSTTA